MATSAGNQREVMVPNQRYKFPDASIHDDIYRIISYTSEEISYTRLFANVSIPGDHLDARMWRAVQEKKIMQMWRAFVEPLLGIYRRIEGAEDIEEAAHVMGLESEGGRVFEGNLMFYGLFRLHQMLYDRLLSAKVKLESSAEHERSYGGATPNLYAEFMHALKGLLDGSVDKLRSIVSTQLYEVIRGVDKLVYNLVRQLILVATDDVALKLLALNGYKNAGGAMDEVHDANASQLFDNEKIFHFEHKLNPSELLVQKIEAPPTV